MDHRPIHHVASASSSRRKICIGRRLHLLNHFWSDRKQKKNNPIYQGADYFPANLCHLFVIRVT